MLLLSFHAHKKTRKCYEVKGCTLLFRVKVVDFDVQRWDWLIRMIWCLPHFHDLIPNSQKVFTFPSLCNQYLYSRICWDKFENCTSDMELIHKWNPAKSSLVLDVTEEMWYLIHYEITWKTKRTSLGIFNSRTLSLLIRCCSSFNTYLKASVKQDKILINQLTCALWINW